jgi:hypothetical protein
MYRQVFTPMVGDILLSIPESWYGQTIEVIAFPVLDAPQKTVLQNVKYKEIDSKYSFSTKKFKFNRDEANDYE